MNIRFYICVLFIALNSYVLLFAGSSGYRPPPPPYGEGGDITLNEWLSCTPDEAKELLKKNRGSLKIKYVQLETCNFTEVPEEIFTFKNLKELYLGYNEIQEIPEAISSLTNLEVLDFSRNKIKVLPEKIGNLGNLRILFLAANQLEYLPESIGHLMNLEQLALSANQLSTLPSSIVNLINIKDAGIDLRRNPTPPNNQNGGYSLDTGFYSKPQPGYLEKFTLKPIPITYERKRHDLQKWLISSGSIANTQNFKIPIVYAVSATSGLSVRNKPKLKAKKIGSMPYKLRIAVYEESSNKETIDGISAPWMRIKALANGQYMEGWAWAGYLKIYKYEEDYQLQFQEIVDEARSKMSNSKITLDIKRIQFLLKNGADINTENKNLIKGWTLLNIVADSGNIKDFRFLLANGANPQIKSKYGTSVAVSVTRREYIKFESKKAFLLTLQDYGYDIKSEGRRLFVDAIAHFVECDKDFEEPNFDPEELDFLKEQLDIKSVSEILSDEDIQTIYRNIQENQCQEY